MNWSIGQVTSHFQNQCFWPISMTAYGITMDHCINSLRLIRNRRHFADDILKWIFLNDNVLTSIKISLNFIPKGPINNIPALVWIMAWHRSDNKPLSEPMMIILLMHICITQPQWVNKLNNKWQWLLFWFSCIKYRKHLFIVLSHLMKKNILKNCNKNMHKKIMESSQTHLPERSHLPQLRVPIDNNWVTVYMIKYDGTIGQAAKSQSSLPHYQSDAALKLPVHNAKSTKDFPPMYDIKVHGVTATSCVIHGGRDRMD